MSKASQRTAGGIALARLGKVQVHIANEIGVSPVTVHQWISGEKRPGAPARAKLLARYGIALSAWDEEQSPRSSRPPKSPSSPAIPVQVVDSEDAGGAFAMARALQRQTQTQLDELETGGAAWTPAEKAQVTQRLASSVNVLAKITGQYEMGRRMLSLPIWKLLERELFAALEPFPEASAAVADRLERFEKSWMRSMG